MRAIRLPGLDKAILSDTVGFISELPTQLVAAFRATLEEVTAADVIVHVRDISNPATSAQKLEVEEILADLDVITEEGASVPMIEAWNKWDLLSEEDSAMRRDLIAAGVPDRRVVPISAQTGEGVDRLVALLSELLTGGAQVLELSVPMADGQKLAWLHAHGEVMSEVETEDDEGTPIQRITVRLTPRELGHFVQL
jgi:GTP-binding protein HflX